MPAARIPRPKLAVPALPVGLAPQLHDKRVSGPASSPGGRVGPPTTAMRWPDLTVVHWPDGTLTNWPS